MLRFSLVILLVLVATKTLATPPSAKPAPKPAPQVTESSEPPLLAGNQITILRWDAASKTMLVALTEEPAVGPNITTIRDLLDAIDFEDADQRKKFIVSPNLLKGLTFTLKKNLKLIPYVPGAKNVPAKI